MNSAASLHSQLFQQMMRLRNEKLSCNGVQEREVARMLLEFPHFFNEENLAMLTANTQFPTFSLKDQDGHTKTNADYKGKWIVAYVYPKDDTPGCTIQGKSFTASKSIFDDLNTVVLGLSADDVESHKNFCNKFGFTITLLADTQTQLLTALCHVPRYWPHLNPTTWLHCALQAS